MPLVAGEAEAVDGLLSTDPGIHTSPFVICCTEDVGKPDDHRASFHEQCVCAVSSLPGATAAVVADGQELLPYSGALNSSP